MIHLDVYDERPKECVVKRARILENAWGELKNAGRQN